MDCKEDQVGGPTGEAHRTAFTAAPVPENAGALLVAVDTCWGLAPSASIQKTLKWFDYEFV